MRVQRMPDRYVIEGKKYDRVSRPLRQIYEAGYTPDEMEFYMNRGTAVHQAVHLWLKGELIGGPAALHEEVRPFFGAFLNFWNDLKPTYIDSEVMVYSKIYKYAGTLDIECHVGDNDDLTIIDLKTGSGNAPRKITAVQTAAYAQAYRETKNERGPIKRMGVLLRGDATYRTKPYIGGADFDAFITLLNAERVKERYA